MIIHLKKNVDEQTAKVLGERSEAIHFATQERQILVTSYKVKELPEYLQDYTEEFFVMDTDMQLSSQAYRVQKRSIHLGELSIGGDSNTTMMIAGPCSIESWEQINQTAQMLKACQIKTLRAGCFKPRTSPYSFQGLGEEGLKMLARVREEYGLNIISEVKDSTHADLVIDYVDIIQVGAKAMYDQGILRACGKSRKPVLLKRGFGTTLQEFVQAAEFILSAGNDKVMLCERGIRTFETKTRFTLDLCGVVFLKHHTNLPVVVDPSHAMGFRYGVPDLARAALAMGVDGLLIETHPTPGLALSDAAQQLSLEDFQSFYNTLEPISRAVGKTLV